MVATPIISPRPQHILVPSKVPDTDTDIYFDIFQLCSDKHAVTSIFCISACQHFGYRPIS